MIESFQLLKKVYRIQDNDYRQRLDELTERLQLSDILHRPVRKLSLGQRMRCELAAALLHNPSIVFLDEPTIGLDILVKTELREFLKSLNQTYGTTILLTTHDLQDIEALCSRVIMLDDGNIIYDGSLEQLKDTWGTGKEIHFQFPVHFDLATLIQLTEGMQVVWSKLNDVTAKVSIPHDTENVSRVLHAVVGHCDIRDIKIVEPNTDDIVRQIYKTGSDTA